MNCCSKSVPLVRLPEDGCWAFGGGGIAGDAALLPHIMEILLTAAGMISTRVAGAFTVEAACASAFG